MRRAPGKPKKQKNKANDEPKKPFASAYAYASTSGKQALIKMNQVTVKCTRYGVLGHNQRTCYGKQAVDKRIPPGKQDIFFSFLICFSYMFGLMFVCCHVLQLQTNTSVEQPQHGKEKQAASKKSVPMKKTVPSKKKGPSKEAWDHLVTTLSHHLLATMSTLSLKLL